jgi:hypothetical protein
MTRQAIYVLASLAVAIALSVVSRADDDGNFCSLKGYLAYELRQGITPGIAGHVVRIVRFDSQHGIRAAGEVTLEDLEVHTMTCDEDRIAIAGFGTVRHGDPPLTRCVIRFGGPQNEISVPECTDDANLGEGWRKVAGPPPPNLGQWGREGSIPLESQDPGHKYYLLLNTSRKKLDDYDWEIHFKTELIQADSQGNVSQRFVVYEAQIVVSGGGD